MVFWHDHVFLSIFAWNIRWTGHFRSEGVGGSAGSWHPSAQGCDSCKWLFLVDVFLVDVQIFSWGFTTFILGLCKKWPPRNDTFAIGTTSQAGVPKVNRGQHHWTVNKSNSFAARFHPLPNQDYDCSPWVNLQMVFMWYSCKEELPFFGMILYE